MLLGGDEMRRTQRGNNNAYCQDNEISWYDWNLAVKNKGLVRFTSLLINLRKNHNIFSRKQYYKESYNKETIPDINWLDINAKVPDWNKADRFLAFKLNGKDSDNSFYIATNTDIYDLTITLPATRENHKWYRLLDTCLDSPEDILEEGKEELLVEQRRYVLVAGCSIILISK